MKYKKSAELIVLRNFSGEGVNPKYHLLPLPPHYVVGFVDGEGSFSVSSNTHATLELLEKIIPFFLQHPLQSKKRKSFDIFRRVVQIIAKKEHLTDAGYAKILALREMARTNGKKTLTLKILGNR